MLISLRRGRQCNHGNLRCHGLEIDAEQKSQEIAQDQVYCVSGKVNSADKLYLVIESVRMDTKNGKASRAAAKLDGAGRQLQMLS